MPLPTPEANESQDDFVGRCMSLMQDEFPDSSQRAAVCHAQWEKGRMSEIKHLTSLAIEIKDVAKGELEAVFATFNVKDHDADWTMPGAFEDGAKIRISAYGHGSWLGKLPVGKGIIRATESEARLIGKFFMSTSHGRDTFETIREMGELQEWSYGYDVLATGELNDELKAQGVRRVLQKLKVHEVSPVLLGAGVNTRTLAVKGSDDIVPITPAEHESRNAVLKELARFERTRARLHGR